ncbi:MAG: sulfatase [Cyclobacteriaceae bacterium]
MANKSLLIIIFFFLGFSKNSFPQNPDRPNILFVIGDDWSHGHAGVYGDPVVKTPNIDGIAKEGAVFLNAFCAAPSCSPSRASVLTGRYPHELEAGASLWGYLPKKYSNYSAILQQAGYHVGLTGKGWGPGNFEAGGYEHNPAGKTYKDFATFLEARPEGQPFSFWFGSQNPHRPYEPGSGLASGKDPGKVKVPGWLPDVSGVRHDILDYYHEVEQFDRQLGEILSILRESGEIENTLIIITGDNGMPFPRAKATLYDSGAKIPLIMSLKGKINPGTEVKELVSLTDIAPTILELTGQDIVKEMTGTTLWPLLIGEKVNNRKMVFIERERHANVRKAELGYPARAIRTDEYLYIRNYEPDRWPAGDPEVYHSVGPYGDVDASPTKEYILSNRTQATVAPFFSRAFAKRNAEELYDLKADPDQLNNVVSDKKYLKILDELKKHLNDWQVRTGDPRVTSSHNVVFDQYLYFGPPVEGAPSNYKPELNK